MKRPKAVNVLALLLDYKNARFPDFGPTDEFTADAAIVDWAEKGSIIAAEAENTSCGSYGIRRPFHVPILVRSRLYYDREKRRRTGGA